MLKIVANKFLLFFYFIVSALILEAVTFYLLDLGGMPDYFFYNLAIMIFIGILIYAIPNYTAQFVLYCIVLGIQVILIYTNYSLITIYGDLFTFDMLNLIGEATNAVTTNFIYLSIILSLITLYAIIVILGSLILHYIKKNKIDAKQHYSALMVILLVVIQVFSLSIISYDRHTVNATSTIGSANYYTSDAFLMNSTLLKKSSYAKFGTYGYMTNLILSLMTGKDQTIANATINYFNGGNIYDGTYVDGSGETVSNGVFGIDEGNNVVVIMMESLEWFAFCDGNYDSEIKNLSSELTPNIYSLIYDGGLINTNFFAKSKTNISESYAITGMYPIGESLTNLVGGNYDESRNTLGYSIPKILSESGYTTSYVHSNEISFYSRSETHGNLGFDNVIGKDNLTDENGDKIYTGDDLKWNNWAEEAEFVNYAMRYIVPETYEKQPFYSFYLNVSSHGAYTAGDNENDKDALKYYDYVMYGEDDCVLNDDGYYVLDDESKRNDANYYTEWYTNILNNYLESDPELVSELVYYECGAVGLDRAIGAIVEKLKNTYYSTGENLYDNTTIVLFSDHYSYYDNLSNRFKRGINESGLEDIEVNTIPLIISSPGLRDSYGENTYVVNDRFSSAYDIIPTLFDLLGIKFNENLYVGHSLFRPADYVYYDGTEMRDMVVYYSHTGGIFSKDIYSYDLSEFSYVQDDISEENKTLLTETFRTEAYNVLQKMNYLNFLNKYSLYNQLTNR